MEPVFAYGCAGKLVLLLQKALAKTDVVVDGNKQPALASEAIDGKFSAATRSAVRLVQKERGERMTGTVNAALWTALTGDTWPDAFHRSLQLLGAFEGHGYNEKTTGNWDGVGMTWGIAGFTMVWVEKVKDADTEKNKLVYHHNSLHTLLLGILAAHRDLVLDAFGKERTERLEKALAETDAKKTFEFAKGITDPGNKKKLLKKWEQGFAKLGAHEVVQELQDHIAKTWYWDKSAARAKEFATDYDMDAEQTRHMFFELWVNPGVMSAKMRGKARDRLDQLKVDKPDATIPEKLEIITALYEEIYETNASDIRQRKGTIALGRGKVHGKLYRLEGWGLDVVNPPLLLGQRLAVLSFEAKHTREQLALAKVARTYVHEEASAEMALRWPTDNGTELIESDDADVRSLSLRPLLGPAAAALAGPGGDDLAHAIALTFQRPIGILALFGQSAPPQVARRPLVFGRGTQGHAGIEATKEGRLRIFRKRLAGFGEKEENFIDIADIRSTLSGCRLLFLYCGHGVPLNQAGTSAGTTWRAMLAPFDGYPIVLGWFGNGVVPHDDVHEFVAPNFFELLGKIAQKATLEQLYQKHPKAIVQAWGAACFKTFGSMRQRFLWRDGPFARLPENLSALREFGMSGAGAIDVNGRIWHANAKYEGTGDAMVEANP